MIKPEGAAARGARDSIEAGGRLGHLAKPDLHPGAEEAVHQHPGALALVERGQRPGIIARPHQLGQKDEVGDLALLAQVRKSRRRFDRGGDIAPPDLGDQGIFQKARVVRIVTERAGEILRRGAVIVFEAREPSGKIGPGQSVLSHGRRPRGKRGGKDEGAKKGGHVGRLRQVSA